MEKLTSMAIDGVDLWLDQKAFAGSSYWGQGSGFH